MDEIPAQGEILPPADIVVEAGNGSSHDDAPRKGTLAWVLAQDTVEREGISVPACNRIPEGATMLAEPDGTRCRVVFASGERCQGTRLHALGLCMGHAGGGGSVTADLQEMSRRGVAKQHSLRLTRQLLGVSASRAADPRVAARLRAALRADDLARAVIDGPLDADIGAIERQRAALAAIDATFPLQAATVELSLSDPEDMSWENMKRLAVSLLG
jgi:hypothetical protein